MKNPKICLLLMLLTAIAASCTDDEIEADLQKDDHKEDVAKRLISSEYVFTRSAQELRVYVDAASLDIPTNQLQYDVDFYRVEYSTRYKGEDITASGVVMIPKTEEPLSVLSFQHGTIAANRQAPSQLSSSNYELILYQGIASAGFMVVVPDYIGFGSSVEIMHPYYVEDLTASAIIDNLYGAKNLADQMEVNLSDHLYLAGYSQGGYATVATHKFIEKNGIDGFELKGSFAGAGGYDIKGVQRFFFDQEIYHQPFFMAYVAQAYDATLDLDTDLSSYFNEPYASAIPSYFDGSLTGGQINDRLNDTLSVLVHEQYLNSSEQDVTFRAMYKALEENSLLDWTPSVRLAMYHGDSDITVPYQNTVDTFNQLIANGASESVLTFTTLKGANHSSGFIPFLEEFVNELIRQEPL